MKQIIFSLSWLAMAAITLSACSKTTLRGEGETITETRAMELFETVEISGVREAEVVYGPVYKVEISGYRNLVQAYESKVVNRVLRHEFPAGSTISNDNIRLKIYTPVLPNLYLSGNTKMTLAPGFNGQHFTVDLSGHSQLTLQAGEAASTYVSVSGTATVKASAFKVKNADVLVSGEAKMELAVTEQLKVNISGMAEVHYWGNPQLSTEISGLGKLIKH